MRPVDVRAKAPKDVAEQQLRVFFRALGKGDWKSASEHVADPIEILGSATSREAFATGNDASLARVLDRLEGLPPFPFTDAQHLELFAGPVAVDDAVFFATLGIGDEGKGTYGVLVHAPTAKVLRLFDPAKFKAWALALKVPS